MKKIYLAPETAIVDLEFHLLDSFSANMDKSETIDNPDDVGARENSSFDAWDE